MLLLSLISVCYKHRLLFTFLYLFSNEVKIHINMFAPFIIIKVLRYLVANLFFVFLVVDLLLIGFMSISRAPFERSNSSHSQFTLVSSTITSCHFSSCTSSITPRSISVFNYSWNLETSCSSSKRRLCKVCFLLFKLSCRIALPLTSFSNLCCKSPFFVFAHVIAYTRAKIPHYVIQVIQMPHRVIQASQMSYRIVQLHLLSTQASCNHKKPLPLQHLL